jgi:hypothetical protein
VIYVSLTTEMRESFKNLDEKPEGKSPVRKHRPIWKDNIKFNHK